MSIDSKYGEMIEKASIAVTAFSTVDAEAMQTVRRLLPLPAENFEKNIRTLMQHEVTVEQKRALDELNYAYMAFVSECKKEFSREELGKIINLTSAFHGLVDLFMDGKGEWR